MRRHHQFEAIGETPLVELRNCSPKPGVRIFAKLEGRNPSGSVKDRIVHEIVAGARKEGSLHPNQPIIEASTGNTGISVAWAGRVLGHAVHVMMPESVFPGIQQTLEAYGAEVDVFPASKNLRELLEMAHNLSQERGWFFLDQFGSPANVRVHYEHTGGEILEALPDVAMVVAGIGTGGTVTGVGQRLKEANSDTLVIGVEPHPGIQLQGLRSLEYGFIPPLLDQELLDGKIVVRSVDALHGVEELMRREALFVGVSSGAVLYGALKAAQRLDRGNIVLVFADDGWKYLGANLPTGSADAMD